MKLRDMLVVLDGSMCSDVVLELTLSVARRHGAHVTGFCPLELLYIFDAGGYPEALPRQKAANRLKAEVLEKARSIEADFRERLRRADVQGYWEVSAGAAVNSVARRAHRADLLVLGQTDPNHPLPPTANHVIEEALINSGRPLLLVPYFGRFDGIGTNVVFGWDSTREAARAAHDALSLIEPTATVTVLTIGRGNSVAESLEVPGADMAEHLARQGLKVSAARTVTDGSVSDGDALLAYASDCGADLLVVGGCGDSRGRQLRDHTTLPVLMSH